MNIKGSRQAYLDRIVFIGDSGSSRLYKDGIGAAYRTAKAAVSCIVFKGISAEDFAGKFRTSYRKTEADNRKGKFIFSVVGIMKNFPFIRRTILAMASKEQKAPDKPQRMSHILWDLFTGSTSYTDIFLRLIHPFFLARLFRNMLSSLRPLKGNIYEKEIER
jgi:flavin-dependent dehydrogenase